MSTTTSRTSRSSAGPGMVPTRQQLDELDALLQRMLDLPVHRTEEEGAAAVPGTVDRPGPADQGYPPSYMVVEEPIIPEPPVPGGRHDLVDGGLPADPVQELAQARLREEAEQQGRSSVPFQSAWQPSAQTWGPLAETWRAARPPEPQVPQPPVMPAWVPPPPLPPSMQEGAPSVWTQTVVIPDAPSSPELPAVVPPSEKREPGRAAVPAVLWPLVAFNACFDVFLWPLGPIGTWLRGPTGRGVLGALGALCLIGAVVVAVLDGIGWTW